MDVFGGVLLGLVQGLTEFLPISSSGHLVLARELFGYTGADSLAFDAVLQLGTLVAVVVFFRNDIKRVLSTLMGFLRRQTLQEQDRQELFALVVGTVPALFAGLALESFMETSFRHVGVVIGALFIGSAIFLLAEWWHARLAEQRERIDIRSGILIGCFQVLALIPGMSRSGMTISGGFFCGLSRVAAARFSFLLSLPIIFLSGVKKLAELAWHGMPDGEFAALGVGFLVSASVGYLCIAFLLRFFAKHGLFAFAVYRVVIASVGAGFLWLGK